MTWRKSRRRLGDLTFKPDDGKRLPCREGEDRTEYLERATGLRLRVSRSGSRTWLVAFWSPVAKTTRRLKLGDAAVMPGFRNDRQTNLQGRTDQIWMTPQGFIKLALASTPTVRTETVKGATKTILTRT